MKYILVMLLSVALYAQPDSTHLKTYEKMYLQVDEEQRDTYNKYEGAKAILRTLITDEKKKLDSLKVKK